MRCPQCGRREECTCVDTCPRCLKHWRQCICEELARPGLHDHDEDRFEPDEEYTEYFQREYGRDDVDDDNAYAHGYNIARRQLKGPIMCPYQDATRSRSFYRGVSDARHHRYLG